VAYLSVSLPQASNASLAVGDRSTQLVIHDAMLHRPAHLPNAYSPERVEGEFLELRLIGFLGCPHAGCCISSSFAARPGTLIFAQWGTPPEGPPFPSMVGSKHIPSAKKTPLYGIGKG
jgi:hypothetical protein